MRNATLLPYASGLLAGILVFASLRYTYTRKRQSLPPGPRPLPLIGNLLDFPLHEESSTWQSYIERYGDVVFLSALGRNFLLLGSYEVINELIEKRANFNDRPRFTMLNDLMDLGWLLVFMPYGDEWRRSRKILHTHIHAGAATAHQPAQLSSARRFVGDLLASEVSRSDDRLSDAAKAVLPWMVRSNFGLTAIRITYGIDVRDPSSVTKFTEIPERVLKSINEAGVPGKFFVDFFPWLQYIPAWFPSARFQRLAATTRMLHHKLREDPAAITKAQIAAGTAPVSIVARMLDSDPVDEQVVKDLAGNIYVAGSDTTVAAVTSFFLAAVVYPEMQRRAQAELDRIVGRDRLPEFGDKDKLPYLEAVMRECFRWLPVIPTGAPHSATEDAEFRGYFIPKGTVVFAFLWGLLQDPHYYPDPSTFSPERYLERLSEGAWKLRTDVPDPRTFAFGFGRRVCPGKHIAEQSLFATLATVLHTLDVARAKDQDGKEIIPDVKVNSGALCHPLPFPYELHMRKDADALVEMCATDANK